MGKLKSIKLSDYFAIQNPNYVYLKLIPSSAIKDYDSSGLAIIANQIYKKFMDRITKKEKTWFYEVRSSIKYIISIRKTEVSFYYIIPEVHVNLAMDAISKCWNNKCTATIVDKSAIRILENPTVYEANYKYEDFMSIKTDSKSNTFLSKALSVVEILEDDDEVQIAINMIPYNRSNVSWKSFYNDMYKKYKSGFPIVKNKKSIAYTFDFARYILTDAIDGIIEGIKCTIDGKTKKTNTESSRISPNFKDLSNSTKDKEHASERLIDTQIFIMSESSTKSKANTNARAICNSFSEVRGDNEFTFKKKKEAPQIEKRVWSNKVNIMHSKENANFIAIPGQTILDEIKCIEHINTLEVPPQEELLNGIVPYGTMTYRGKLFTMYLNENGELAFLPLLVMTKQGGGKSTWFENIGVFLMNNFKRKMKDSKPAKKESLFIIDFIKNCEMSYNIMHNIDAKDIVIIDPLKEGFGFNEVEIDLNNKEEVLKKSSDQSQEMMKFIDTINEQGEPLSPKMRRYLNAACRICFIHPGQSFRTVIQILEYADVRKKYINLIPVELMDDLEGCIRKLEELDDGNGGTKSTLVQGVLDRAGLLEEDYKLERMYNRSIKNNVNIAKAIQEGKAVFVLMPQNDYRTPMIKNILVTYYISKLFLSSIIRAESVSSKNLTRCTLIIDEVFQAPGCFSTFDNILTQLRKFRVRPILSAHNWQQIKYFEKNLKDAGLSLVLPQGSNKDNFLKMEDEFAHNGFDIDNLLNLKKWNSLNAIQTDKGFTSFISEFPPPVKGKIEDREDITFKEFKKDILNRIKEAQPEVIEEVEVDSDKVVNVDFIKKEVVEKELVYKVEEKVAVYDDVEFEIIEEDEIVILDEEENIEEVIEIKEVVNYNYYNSNIPLLPAPQEEQKE